jgi:hypothetical protein
LQLIASAAVPPAQAGGDANGVVEGLIALAVGALHLLPGRPHEGSAVHLVRSRQAAQFVVGQRRRFMQMADRFDDAAIEGGPRWPAERRGLVLGLVLAQGLTRERAASVIWRTTAASSPDALSAVDRNEGRATPCSIRAVASAGALEKQNRQALDLRVTPCVSGT